MIWKWKNNKSAKISETISVASPLTGTCVSLEEVPDEAFAQGLMGPGVAVIPQEGRLVAPIDGTVVHLIKSHHAVMIEHASGLQLLLHIGMNTVSLKGQGFTPRVQTGDQVAVGQTLIEFDLNAIASAGYPVITPVIVANAAEQQWESNPEYGHVEAGMGTIMKVSLSK
ncbi:PTS sugar transporter subunit IIA [Paenibacillus illinoisensis]|uniref:Putative glucose-specific phosphotransferase enzyme IIA component n=1 Tax=Paenibacillus illinoisensis TaxID=59845 RepID=A0A2W0CCP3_9BACL|nr:PTS glucose transporter subunit IIA [Paenibacillus illinoisensis]PYY29957.1 putative glucose-specific phosphotransferase enzyme IIA component [Paenibacillus illinoisensis]